MSNPTSQPNFAARLANVPEQPLIAELTSALSALDLNAFELECTRSAISRDIEAIRTAATMLRNRLIEHHRALGLSIVDISNHTNGIIDHAEALDPADHPDNNDRDAGRVCPSCDHDLELNADFQCVRCGSPS